MNIKQLPNNSGSSAEFLGRRQLLKALAVTGGIIATSTTLPGEWIKPIIEVGYLPAHAQASSLDLWVSLTWDTGNPNANSCAGGGSAQGAVDIDLHMVEPDGTRVFFLHPNGPTAFLDFDNKKAFGPENISVPAGRASNGVYRVQVSYFCGAIPTIATIMVKSFAYTGHEQSATFTRTLTTRDDTQAINVAEITFPVGAIREIGGTTQVLTLQGVTKT